MPAADLSRVAFTVQELLNYLALELQAKTPLTPHGRILPTFWIILWPCQPFPIFLT
jgi:hypothetical protein